MEITIVVKSTINPKIQIKFDVDTHTCTMKGINDEIETAIVEIAAKNFEIGKLKTKIEDRNFKQN